LDRWHLFFVPLVPPNEDPDELTARLLVMDGTN
jgi:hypothetical protein